MAERLADALPAGARHVLMAAVHVVAEVVLAIRAALRPAPGRRIGRDEVAMIRDALGAAGARGPIRVLGPAAGAVVEGLRPWWPDTRAVGDLRGAPEDCQLVLAGVLESRSAREAVKLLRACRGRAAVVATPPLWPSGWRAALDDAGVRTLKSRSWWMEAAAGAGFAAEVELRRPGAPLVLTPARPAPRTARVAAAPASGPTVRVNDPLDVANSFAWISASIALALDDLGIRVTIAPTAISASFDDERRARLSALVEPRNGSPAGVDSELGWTHFWPQYGRRLGGRVPLALFAINYDFRGRDPAAMDPWMRELVSGGRPLAPISTFCRDVLRGAGVPDDLLRVVPLAFTDGLRHARPRSVPGARSFKILHTTNAMDAARNGTDIALAAFADAFAPDDDVTLVVRDYTGDAPGIRRDVGALAAAGYDARYWPVFFSQAGLGDFIASFDVLLAPFRGEGFGIKVLDAMACGVTPICPFFGGPRDFVDAAVAIPVDHDVVPVRLGYDAERLALGNDPVWAECRHDALVEALRLAASGEAARLAEPARRRALERFSWEQTARRVLELVEG